MAEQNKRKRGAEGEDVAAKYLEEKGYKIIKRNFHFGKVGEVDIIAKNKDILVFVEVRTAHTGQFGHPLESLNYKKLQSFRKASEGYLYVNKIKDQMCRLDVIAVNYVNGKADITHLENAV